MAEPEWKKRELEPGAGEGAELRARLQARDRHLEELHEELAHARLEADEQRAARSAAEERVRALERRASILDKRVRYYQRGEQERGGYASREERRVRRLERALERREAEKARLRERISKKDHELARLRARERSLSSRRDDALERAVRRVRELERELGRESED